MKVFNVTTSQVYPVDKSGKTHRLEPNDRLFDVELEDAMITSLKTSGLVVLQDDEEYVPPEPILPNTDAIPPEPDNRTQFNVSTKPEGAPTDAGAHGTGRQGPDNI